MPKEKDFLKVIPRIYKRNYEDLAMFFFVEAQRQIVPAITLEQGLFNFFRYCCVEDFNIDSAKTTYMRLKHEWYENAKANK